MRSIHWAIVVTRSSRQCNLLNVLLHIPFENIIDEESERDVAHAGKMKNLHSVDDLGWRNKYIHRGKILAQTMTNEYTTTVN